MARKKTIIDSMLEFPWWLHLVASIFIFLSSDFLYSYFESSKLLLLTRLSKHTYIITTSFSIIFLFFSLIVFYKKCERKYLFSHQNNLQDLYAINWQQFETLITEVFYRAGYSVKQRGGKHPDGGVDLEAYQAGIKIIIQCKHWKKKQVGVSIVREMLGVAVHEKAHQVYIITCGYFTKDAKEFAEGKAIHLIHGYKLLEWIKNLK